MEPDKPETSTPEPLVPEPRKTTIVHETRLETTTLELDAEELIAHVCKSFGFDPSLSIDIQCDINKFSDEFEGIKFTQTRKTVTNVPSF